MNSPEDPAFRPDAVGRGQAGPRLLDYRQPRGAIAQSGGAGDAGAGRSGDARTGLRAEPARRWPREGSHPFDRRAGADDRQFDLRRYRAGSVRRIGAARLRRDPGAVALRRRARRPHALGIAVAAPRGDHHGGLARHRRRGAAIEARGNPRRGDLGPSGVADRRRGGFQQLRSRRHGGAASHGARPQQSRVHRRRRSARHAALEWI